MILNLEAIFCLGGKAYKNFPHLTLLLFRKKLESSSSRHSPIISIFLLLLPSIGDRGGNGLVSNILFDKCLHLFL